jgi:protein-S-isoprenylcysteine O-methyltransferase Ste14
MHIRHVSQRVRIHLLQAVGLAFATAFLLAQPVLVGPAHELVEMVGFCLVLFCLGGRMWSILYIGSRKNRELVTSGPYSVTRNPLYFASTIGAVGIGLIYGSVVIALLLGLLAYGILLRAATKEAEHLKTTFGGARSDAYAKHTPLFWPNLSRYRDEAEVAFSTSALRQTFLDGLFFLAAFPALEVTERLQADGVLPVLMRIF